MVCVHINAKGYRENAITLQLQRLFGVWGAMGAGAVEFKKSCLHFTGGEPRTLKPS